MIFKKHISILLTIFLLVSNLGLAFNVHYCDDEIASVSINTASNSHEIEKDCCGTIEKESKCCKNKIIKSTEKSDQIVVKITSVDSNYNLVFNDWKPITFINKKHFTKRDISTYYCDANAPPLYLLYSQYTFYA
ncbi:hypothetical protein OX283_000140 [Flavobacterium sp. SUN052]|uniref:HYC_CC_PP family protein n=1 Tax=Flavobacterium sp. SUN052 TaxID=3002441 RepID=UPI00237D8571|nr:hypothetical protein [Flavobacterium sp. SUN052]MEC4003052.1 hypothetical protein [Flavobacterium sp. SUN052]